MSMKIHAIDIPKVCGRSFRLLVGIAALAVCGLTADSTRDIPMENSSDDLAGILTDIKTDRTGDDLIVRVLANRSSSPQAFVLEDPPRLVLDFHDFENQVPFLNLPIRGASVQRIRVRQYQSTEPKIARLVFDLISKKDQYDIQTEGRGVRITFRESFAQVNETSPPLIASSQPIAIAAMPDRSNSPPAFPQFKRSNPYGHSPAKQILQPIINDLAASEIPMSALAQLPAPAASQPLPLIPVAPRPRPRSKLPLVMTPPAPLSSSSTLVLTARDFSYNGEPLTLDLVDIPLVDFFRLMAEEGGINIVMDPEIRGTTSIKVVKVPWDQIFDSVLINNGLDKDIAGNLVRIASKTTLQEEAKQAEALKRAKLLAADVETRIRRLNYAKAEAFIPHLQDLKTVRGTVVADEASNSLIMTDLPESIKKMEDLVAALDIPQPQVEIEARIVSATRDFARDIGVQFGFVQGNLERVSIGGPNTFGTIGGTRPTATPISTFAAGDSRSGRGAADGTSSQSAGVSTGSSSQNAGNLNVNLPSQKAFGGVGISVGNIFDTFLLDAAITAGESKGLAKLISQPKVTAQNNAPATVMQGLRFPVQIIANNTVTVQFQNAALTLTVTPQITYEGNIVLDLKIENNTPDFGRQVNGIPSIRISESQTRVLVSDGGTTVIGGILMDTESTTEERVPGLSSLPIIGYAFKRKAVNRSVQEVIFFITPRIVK